MEESDIIWHYLEGTFPNEHHIIYIYCCGQKQSRINATKKIFEDIFPIFGRAFHNDLLKNVIECFLEFKKKQYKNGEIKVKSIY